MTRSLFYLANTVRFTLRFDFDALKEQQEAEGK